MATNYVKASYTEVIDLQTTTGSTSIIGLHTPVGRRPYSRLNGFFNQFRKYRYKGISSLVMVPAANLPVDPLGLTGVTGTTDLMDPRDALNPILFHGCHGENLNEVLNTIYSADERISGSGGNTSVSGKNTSDSASETKLTNSDIGTYYKCLTDTSWKKFGIQSGVKLKGLHPLVHKLAQNAPLIPGYAGNAAGTNTIREGNTGELVEYNVNTTTGAITTSFPTGDNYVTDADLTAPINQVPNVRTGTSDYMHQYVQQFTNGMTRLGWIPTTKPGTTGYTGTSINTHIAILPKLFMGVLVMPPSYNIQQFFRCVIRHEFEFADFTTSLGAQTQQYITAPDKGDTSYYNWIDYGDKKDPDPDDPVTKGETIDMIGGEAEVISDGVA